MVDPIRANNELWDVWTRIHAVSPFYDLEGFKRGGVRLSEEEIAALGDSLSRVGRRSPRRSP